MRFGHGIASFGKLALPLFRRSDDIGGAGICMASQHPSSPEPPLRICRREGALRKHAEYQRVYREGKRQSLPLMTFFFAPQAAVPTGHVPSGLRIGLTAGKVLGNAVVRNRIKRRMREAIRQHRTGMTLAMDVIFHPRRAVFDAEFDAIERDVKRALRTIEAADTAASARGAAERPNLGAGSSRPAKSLLQGAPAIARTDAFHGR